MEKLPTAKEFFTQTTGLRIEGEYLSEIGGSPIENNEIFRFAIEFAKLHVEAALESAYRNQSIEDERVAYSPDPEYRATKESIINSYPLTNIK